MNIRKTVILILVVQATILATVVVLLGFVPGIAAQSAMADSVQHFSLLASTMQPLDSSIRYNNTGVFLKTIQGSTINTSTAYVGQVDLPNGARIVGVRGFGLDSDPIFEFAFQLYRYNLYGNPVGSPVTSLASSGAYFQDGKIVMSAPVYSDMAVIDNDQYSYGILLTLPVPYSPPYQDLGVLRFVVDAGYSVQLPLVQKNAR